MGRHSNKKRYHASHDRETSRDFGLADTLHDVKRRKLSTEDSDATSLSTHRNGVMDGLKENDGWQTVPLRSDKRRDRRHRKPVNHDRSSYPELTFDRKITRPIQIEQLRDLALYVLADGTGPDWVGINNSRGIGKVVAVMIPGLDHVTMKKTRELLDSARSHTESSRAEMPLDDTNDDDEARELDPGAVSVDSHEGANKSHNTHNTNSPVEPHTYDWLLNNTFPVKAPGDAKYSKVHSPLQAMLIAPEVPNKTRPNHSGDRTSNKPTAIPITDFVLTSEDLREAEYPIHPAAFTSAADSALESERRERTQQSSTSGWLDSIVTESGPLIPPTSPAQPLDKLSKGLDVYAVDCEMVLTSDEKSSLARISVVSWPSGKVVLDKYVKPELPIENYFTQYSGITPEILQDVTTKLSDIQQELLTLLTPSTVLLGHSLESDLNALKMTHPFIIDTSILYPHPRGLPLRSSLKFLAKKYLKREIQMGGANGHDSVEDARAVLDLVKLKCEKGAKFGTTEANGEVMFKRLSRHSRKDGKPLTSAIVEYGSSPERGLGKDATYAIGCQSDGEIVDGIRRAVKGDEDGKEIPASGVDFIWGRLRALEFAKGWATQNNVSPKDNSSDLIAPQNGEVSNTSTTEHTDSSQLQDNVHQALLNVLHSIDTIRKTLPPTALLIIYNGTSDVRPLLKLQAIQAQYRKEFKVKKWDELSVKWTDVEEQALRNATEQARMGWGWIGIA